jgi:hypothetical protein
VSPQMFFSSKHCSTRFALVILQLQVYGTDVSLIALLPRKLHAAVLTLVLLLVRMHGPHVDGQTVVAAVHLPADWTSYLPVHPLDVVVDIAWGSKCGMIYSWRRLMVSLWNKDKLFLIID